eukprot:GHRQ01038606.1.p1 GENE.GHRQ01038606.1~~GHRQ01038606.1.p1  ORF type:complete len:247 (+),score=27.54 GHRQ01038606.1:168-908(+)
MPACLFDCCMPQPTKPFNGFLQAVCLTVMWRRTSSPQTTTAATRTRPSASRATTACRHGKLLLLLLLLLLLRVGTVSCCCLCCVCTVRSGSACAVTNRQSPNLRCFTTQPADCRRQLHKGVVHQYLVSTPVLPALWPARASPCCRLPCLRCTCSISDDRGYLSVFAGMWAGLELSVTRALGHKHLEAHGVLCEPAVRSLSLQSEDTCLVSCLALSRWWTFVQSVVRKLECCCGVSVSCTVLCAAGA